MARATVPLSDKRRREGAALVAWARSLDREQTTYDEWQASRCRPEREGARRREPRTRPRRRMQ